MLLNTLFRGINDICEEYIKYKDSINATSKSFIIFF